MFWLLKEPFVFYLQCNVEGSTYRIFSAKCNAGRELLKELFDLLPSEFKEVEQQDVPFQACKIVESLGRGTVSGRDSILQDSAWMAAWMQAEGQRCFSVAFWTVLEKCGTL